MELIVFVITDSREFRSVYVRSCHTGDAFRSHVCDYRVCGICDICDLREEGRENTDVGRNSAILASFLLDEKLGRLGVCGCASCIVSAFFHTDYQVCIH
jgi:hypothetical protein